MNKNDLIVRIVLTVLVTGLVSCAKDDNKTRRDNFKAPSPVINNNGKQDLKTWDRLSDKSLDLQDSFDVSAGSPAKLQVTARCRRDQIHYQESFQFVPRGAIKIYQVLPPELLTSDLKVEKTDCAFELILSNEVGSKHIYQISTVPLTDDSAAAVLLERTGSDEKILRIQARKLEGMRIRYRNAGAAAAQVLCQDMFLADLPFEQVLDFNHFDFSKPELKPGRNGEALVENPLQACRILIRQAGQIQQLSARFLVQLPQRPLAAAIAQVLVPDVTERLNFFNGAGLGIAVAKVGNPDRYGSRQIVLRKAPFETVIEIFGHVAGGRPAALLPPNTITSNSLKMNWMHVRPLPAPGISILDNGDHWRVTFPAGLSVQLAVDVLPSRARICPPDSLRVHDVDLAVAGGFSFREVSERGEILDEKTIVVPRVSYPGPNAFEQKAVKTEGFKCAW